MSSAHDMLAQLIDREAIDLERVSFAASFARSSMTAFSDRTFVDGPSCHADP